MESQKRNWDSDGIKSSSMISSQTHSILHYPQTPADSLSFLITGTSTIRVSQLFKCPMKTLIALLAALPFSSV
jgi:hypothetical protein